MMAAAPLIRLRKGRRAAMMAAKAAMVETAAALTTPKADLIEFSIPAMRVETHRRDCHQDPQEGSTMDAQIVSPRRIPLGKTGLFALVDESDFEWLSQWKWGITSNQRYAKRTAYEDNKSGSVYMHRAIMKAGFRKEVDHRDGNGLNNQRSNLRICSRMENTWNRMLITGGVPLKGVRRIPSGKYRATITCKGKYRHLGYFDSPIEAAQAYNMAAESLFGQFSRINNLK